jgi:hypothetical protein
MRLKQLQDILKENPDAAFGNWSGYGELFKKEITKDVFETNWDIIEQFEFQDQLLIIAKLSENKNETWLVGKFITIDCPDSKTNKKKEVFSSLLQATLNNHSEIGNLLSYKNLHQVMAIYINKENQAAGLATYFYKWLVNNYNYTILSDKLQYFGARRLWAKLSDSNQVNVDIIDINQLKIIEKNKILIHGKAEDSFDKTVWARYGKADIRFVLTKI